MLSCYNSLLWNTLYDMDRLRFRKQINVIGDTQIIFVYKKNNFNKNTTNLRFNKIFFVNVDKILLINKLVSKKEMKSYVIQLMNASMRE